MGGILVKRGLECPHSFPIACGKRWSLASARHAPFCSYWLNAFEDVIKLFLMSGQNYVETLFPRGAKDGGLEVLFNRARVTIEGRKILLVLVHPEALTTNTPHVSGNPRKPSRFQCRINRYPPYLVSKPNALYYSLWRLRNYCASFPFSLGHKMSFLLQWNG
jgi:hypothetical protein